ncbi:DUF2938 domain-containing protein [Zhouia spongiae]|uniref:DUF2938 domain-containing protein n=1 Tax=Zhouia spongiae TaxID=2202721 RepID=A0ABY3YLU9_9FLAO|nr:DUF2938 family protein [Zhouia spongiae]UNY98590.1 DUF2938 domain-containing protein [Zhouia spongiae]
MKTVYKTILAGIGATLFIDFWKFIASFFEIRSRGVLFLGRWLAYIIEGQFSHHTIVQTPSAENERFYGLFGHYFIGVIFSFLLPLLYGSKWFSKPTLLPSIMVGLVSLLPAVFIMQPLFGFGIVFSKIPDSSQHLLKVFIIHLIYAIGLYLIAIALKRIKLFNP